MFNFDVLFVFWRRAKKPHSEGGLNKKWGGWPTFGNVIIWSPKNTPLLQCNPKYTCNKNSQPYNFLCPSVGQLKECHPRNCYTTSRWWNAPCIIFWLLSQQQIIGKTTDNQCTVDNTCLDISKDMHCITGHLCGCKSSAKQETTCEHAPV